MVCTDQRATQDLLSMARVPARAAACQAQEIFKVCILIGMVMSQLYDVTSTTWMKTWISWIIGKGCEFLWYNSHIVAVQFEIFVDDEFEFQASGGLNWPLFAWESKCPAVIFLMSQAWKGMEKIFQLVVGFKATSCVLSPIWCGHRQLFYLIGWQLCVNRQSFGCLRRILEGRHTASKLYVIMFERGLSKLFFSHSLRRHCTWHRSLAKQS